MKRQYDLYAHQALHRQGRDRAARAGLCLPRARQPGAGAAGGDAGADRQAVRWLGGRPVRLAAGVKAGERGTDAKAASDDRRDVSALGASRKDGIRQKNRSAGTG